MSRNVDSPSNRFSTCVRRILTGAVLDEIRVHSTQMWLRFLSDQRVSGKLVYVDLVFGCAAYLVDAAHPGDLAEFDFFEQRSVLLANLYRCIGHEMAGAEVADDGRLRIDVGNGKALILRPSEQDLGDDDSVWRLSVEDKPGDTDDLPYVYCVANGEGFEVGSGRKL